MNINNTAISALVDMIKDFCLYDKDIQGRRATRWNKIIYFDFCFRHDTEDGATRACIDSVTFYQKDLSTHLTSGASLPDRIKQIFSNEPWYATIYERSNGYQTALMLSQALITTTTNADNWRRAKGSKMSINHV